MSAPSGREDDRGIDRPGQIRAGEELDVASLRAWLDATLDDVDPSSLSVRQFRSGHSNLTYALKLGDGTEYVLRRPPHGVHVETGHDMSREWRVLSALHPVWSKVPEPIAYCEDDSVVGAPFYLMERVRGVILRANDPERDDLDATTMREASRMLVDTLVEIHNVDLEEAGLSDFGRPDGYVERQVEGWIERYEASKTDDIEAMDRVAERLREQRPPGLASVEPTLIHNDYKYDNLVLNPDDLSDVRAVLDWEMATVGNPWMDLGTTLAYWIEPDDPEVLKQLDLGPTLLAGNLSREEIVDRYATRTGRDQRFAPYCTMFGMYKVAVIGQQLYYRFEQGHTEDPRLGQLIHAVRALARRAAELMEG